MRVALFSGNYNYIREGANQALNRLVRYAEDQGHEVRVYSPVTETPAFKPEGTLVPVPSVALPRRSEFRLALGLPRATRDDIRRFAPDVIHVSTPDILNTRAQSFAKELRIPIVASMHTRFETYFDYYGLGWAKPLARAHLDRFYRRSDHVLAPTPGIVAEMKRARGDEKVSLWSRGVDRSLFDPCKRDKEWRRAQGWSNADIVVLSFGRLVLEKGVRDFVAIVQQLRGQGVGVKPLVVGEGPARNEFAKLGDARMTGHLDGEDLARAVASSDILVHPSSTEAFGNVLLEAMACGLATISAETDSSRSLIDQGYNGLLCPPGDIHRFTRELRRLAADEKLRRELGREARAASRRFDWNAASASAMNAYLSVMMQGPGS